MRPAVLIVCALAATSSAQTRDEALLARGAKVFAERCSTCHGKDGQGGQAPNLHASRIVMLAPPPRFIDLLRQGIAGAGMPPLPDTAEARAVVAFVHSIARPGMGAPAPGDPGAGRVVFAEAGCARCHIVEGKGGVLGPDLSAIAIQSSRAEIRRSVVEPAARVRDGFRAVTLTTRDGRRVEGVLKNEDNFSVQVLTLDGDPRVFDRSTIARIERRPGSLMPADVARRLDETRLQNLLAFLDRQRAPMLRSELGFTNY